MKRRTANKIRNYKVLPKRLTNKAIWLFIHDDERWSVGFYGRDYHASYFMDDWGRVHMYARTYHNGKVVYGRGYDVWHNDELYHIHNNKH